MQWTGDEAAGFTSGTPWLPVNSDYTSVNVEVMEEDETSHLAVYRQLTKLRHTETILFGDTQMMTESTALAIARVKKGNPGYLAVINFGAEPVKLNVNLDHIPERGTLTLISSRGEATTAVTEPVGSSVSLRDFSIQGHTSVLVTFVPSFA